MTQFILIIPGCKPDQQRLVTGHFAPARASYWHWSPDVWLLNFAYEDATPDTIRDELMALLPGISFVVFPIPLGTVYAGWGPHEWQQWFSGYWR